jgi:hypothetical protein
MWIDKGVLPLGVKLDDVVLMKRRDGSVAGPGEAGTFIWCNYDSPRTSLIMLSLTGS